MNATELQGLSSKEAHKRLETYGPNSLPEKKSHPLLSFLHKFWAPIPWMLEVIVILELILSNYRESSIIAALLLFNACVSFFEEGRAKHAVRLLRHRLDVKARVLRDHMWSLLSAKEIVQGDVIHIRQGDIVPADLQLLFGDPLIDQSIITGEAFPIEPKKGEMIYAGSIVKRGEATAQVLSTGKRTFFGKSAEIMQSTNTPSHLERTIFSIVKYLIIGNLILITFAIAYSLFYALPFREVIPFSLLLLVASVPIALPATFTLATALGSLELAKSGIFTTRLSAIEEAAAMNVLCVDKTGTLTENRLTIAKIIACNTYTKDDVLALASFTCDPSTQDPLDLPILQAAQTKHSPFSSAEKLSFFPFDPEKKSSGARIQYQGKEIYVFKGALTALAPKLRTSYKELDQLVPEGFRTLAIALTIGSDNYELVGLLEFEDRPRDKTKQVLQEIQDLGIKVIMITGDGIKAARSIARQVGLGVNIISRDQLHTLTPAEIANSDGFFGIFPEDKFHIIQLLQNKGYICGMTGDGVNDAPALKKAEVGIAVSNATDVAKAAASLVLTRPGLTDILTSIKVSRQIYQRMLTYTLNKIIKTLEICVILSLGFLIVHNFIISQILIVLLLFTNDFITMSLSTDRVSFSRKPDKWNIRNLMTRGGGFALFVLIFSFTSVIIGNFYLHFSLPELQTWTFLTLVFTCQATLYLVRERKHAWTSMPGPWVLICSLLDIFIVGLMATFGLLMTSLPFLCIVTLLGAVILYFFLLDFLKIRIWRV